MPFKDLLLPEFDYEMGNTRKLLECVPEGKAAWQPHEKSMTLGRLATHIAELAGRAPVTLAQAEFDPYPPGTTPQRRTLESRRELLELFDANAPKSRAALAAAADGDFTKPWTFKRQGQVMVQTTRYQGYRNSFLSHLTHHRAQLGVYLRLLGVEIPGMYGPSADDLAKRK